MWQKIKCWLGFHEWTRQLDMYNLDYTYRCKHCGKVKR